MGPKYFGSLSLPKLSSVSFSVDPSTSSSGLGDPVTILIRTHSQGATVTGTTPVDRLPQDPSSGRGRRSRKENTGYFTDIIITEWVPTILVLTLTDTPAPPLSSIHHCRLRRGSRQSGRSRVSSVRERHLTSNSFGLYRHTERLDVSRQIILPLKHGDN